MFLEICDSLRHSVSRLKSKPWLTLLTAILGGVLCGISAGQFCLIQSFNAPGRPREIGALYHLRLSVKDGRWERRLPYGTAALVRESSQIESSGVYRPATLLLTYSDWGAAVAGAYVDPGLLPTFRAEIFKGNPSGLDDPDGGVYVSHGLWRRMPSGISIGDSVAISGEQCTLLGVLGPGFEVPDGSELLIIKRDMSKLAPEGNAIPVNLVVRLRHGIRSADFAAQASVINKDGLVWVPDADGVGGVEIKKFTDYAVGEQGVAFLAGLSGITLVFGLALMATVVLLVQLSERSDETSQSMRLILGASKKRLAVTSAVQATVVTLLSIPFCYLAARGYDLLLTAAFSSIRRQVFWLDPQCSVLAMIIALLLLAGVLLTAFIMPLWRLKAVVRHSRTVKAVSQNSWSIGFVALQMFTCVCLIAGCILVGITCRARHHAASLLARDAVVTFRIALPSSLVASTAEQTRLVERARDSLLGIPGVSGVSFARRMEYKAADPLAFEIRPVDHPIVAPFDVVRPGYFNDLGIHVIEGREFSEADGAEAPRVALITRSFAARYFPNRSPLGEFIRPKGYSLPSCRIVGVVPDLDMAGPASNEANTGGVYLCFWQAWRIRYLTGLVRFQATAPGNSNELISMAVRSVAPGLFPYWIKTIEDSIEEQFAVLVSISKAAIFYAVIVVCLTALSLGALTMFQTQRAAPEIALRLALGCSGRRAIWETCRRTWISALVGALFGGTAILVGLLKTSAVLPVVTDSVTIESCIVLAVISALGIVGLGTLPALRHVARLSLANVLR
jgi:putative ABC transport system permease protein